MKKLSLILLGVLLIFTFASCKKDCDHVYDNACDATCNECGETREVGAHDFADADCDTPKTCKVCGATEGAALGHNYEAATCTDPKTCKTCGLAEGAALGHKPSEDDGDCTTAIQCTVCGEVTTAAKAQHILAADDGDCTTPITCTECTTVLTAAKSHDFTGDYVADETQHWHVCKNDGCNVTDEKINHASDGAATVNKPEKCSVCEYIINPQLPHDHTYNVADYNDTHHYMRCICGEIDETTKVGHSPISDNDCTTPDKCTCGYTVTAATNHVAGDDDGNCTTAIQCANCGQMAVAGNTDHVPAEDDGDCTTAVKCKFCDVTVLEATNGHTPDSDDGDCTTDSKCRTCGTVLEKGNDSHTPVEDDGNCSTPQGCVNCDQTVVAGKEHTDADHDYTCDNSGCQVAVNPPKDENDGIDLPIDTN